MDFLAIIQARTESTRLPNKVLMKLGHKTVLENVISRVKKSNLISDIVVATTLKNEDIKIVNICSKNNIKVFCGEENNVLSRFYQLSKILKAKNIVRITSDCPVIDPNIIDLVIQKYKENNVDYVSNTLTPTFPDGLDVEVFSFYSLEKAFFESTLLSDREHVTPYIYRNKDLFKSINITNSNNLSYMRWTLDNIEDFNFLEKIYIKLYNKKKLFLMNDILKLLEKEPYLININKHIERNQGYKKSLNEDLS
jgi:spore coat polysaccharide biosynthesis protein SpsF (cytidylyltransferase family)